MSNVKGSTDVFLGRGKDRNRGTECSPVCVLVVVVVVVVRWVFSWLVSQQGQQFISQQGGRRRQTVSEGSYLPSPRVTAHSTMHQLKVEMLWARVLMSDKSKETP